MCGAFFVWIITLKTRKFPYFECYYSASLVRMHTIQNHTSIIKFTNITFSRYSSSKLIICHKISMTYNAIIMKSCIFSYKCLIMQHLLIICDLLRCDFVLGHLKLQCGLSGGSRIFISRRAEGPG